MKLREIENCPVCNSDRKIYLFRDKNRREGLECFGTYVQCCECSLVYLSERPPWEEIVPLYSLIDIDSNDKSVQINASDVEKDLRCKIISIIKKMLRKIRFRPHSWPLQSVLPKSKRLLDLGCGNGAKLLEFENRGYDVWGIDLSNDSIRLCRQLLPDGHFMQGELQETGLPDNYFDYIRIDNTLEHVPNPKEVVQECFRLLKKEGTILIYVPHGRSFSMRFMKGNSISSWIPFHLQLFTYNSLRLLFKEAGFINFKSYGYYPSTWLSLSFIQWKNKGNYFVKFSYPNWLNLVCYPLGWLSVKLGLGEELVGIGIKS